MINGHDTDRARDALQRLPPDCDRAAWVKTGMAFHAAGGDFDTFDQWSAGADSYNAQAARATWSSFKSTPGGVTAGALFGLARDHGWTDSNESQRPAPARATRPPEQRKQPAPGQSASEVWNRCTPATNQHEYIVAKQGNPKGLRVVPDGDKLTIAGQNMAGYLAVSAIAPDGDIQSI